MIATASAICLAVGACLQVSRYTMSLEVRKTGNASDARDCFERAVDVAVATRPKHRILKRK